MKTIVKLSLVLVVFCFVGCTKPGDDPVPPPPPSTANVVFKFKFDSTQVRLNNIGQPSAIPAGNGAQSPIFNSMSAHYVELAPSAFTALGAGEVLYKAPQTDIAGQTAIEFDKAKFAGNNEIFFTMPIKDIKPGNYEWLRISLAYQNYDVKFRIDTTISGFSINQDFTGTVASFIGFNTYLKSYLIKTQSLTVNDNRKQGYWAFETTLSAFGMTKTLTGSGQAPDGATTVVNPLFASSPIPAGSCVVTAAFAPGKLTITGTEASDIVIEVSLSTNKSFEWQEIIQNGKWDGSKGEPVVDMGVRGMIPTIK
ncbi:MAG TPA: hypothetical protein VKA49_07990 [Flavitalea sp.]|nr:hypothetical protein [Flavitalea sp.]